MGRYLLKSVLLLLLVNSMSGFSLALMYISLSKPHSFPCFLTASAAGIIHRNHFYHLFQQNKPEYKVKFKQASNHCQRVSEAAKLAYANNTKESIASKELGSHNFLQIAYSVLNKGKSAIHPLFNSPEVLFSPSDKAKLFA